MDHQILFVFKVGHSVQRKTKPTPRRTHHWRCYVDSWSPRYPLSAFVKKVTFKLHDTFDNPKQVVRQAPFAIEEDGFGNFRLQIEVAFFDCVTNFPYDLTLFDHNALHTYRTVRIDPAPEDWDAMIQLGGMVISRNNSQHDVQKVVQTIQSSSAIEKLHPCSLFPFLEPRVDALDQLRNTVSTLSTSNTSALTEQAHEHRLVQERLNTELAQLKQINEDKSRYAARLKAQLDEAQTNASAQQRQLKDAITLAETRKTELAGVHADYSQLRIRSMELEEQYSAAQARVKQLESTVSELEARLAELETDKVRWENRCARLVTQNSELEVQAQQKVDRARELQSLLDISQQERSDLERRVTVLREQLRQTEADWMQSRDQLSQARAALAQSVQLQHETSLQLMRANFNYAQATERLSLLQTTEQQASHSPLERSASVVTQATRLAETCDIDATYDTSECSMSQGSTAPLSYIPETPLPWNATSTSSLRSFNAHDIAKFPVTMHLQSHKQKCQSASEVVAGQARESVDQQSRLNPSPSHSKKFSRLWKANKFRKRPKKSH